MSPIHRMLAAVSVGAAGVALITVLAVPTATAAPMPTPGCPEGAGAAGKSCVIHLRERLSAAPMTRDCQLAIEVLAADRKAGVADEQTVTDARAADKKAMDTLKAAEVSRDQAIAAAQAAYAAGPQTAAALATRDAAIQSANDTYAAALVAYNGGGTAAKLHDALAKLRRDELAYKRALVVVELNCKPAPTTVVTPPAPVVIESPPVIVQAPAPIVVPGDLAVTG